MDRQKTCKERVSAHYAGRLADLGKLWKAYCQDPEGEVPDLGRLDEFGLSFDYVAPGTFNGQRRGYFRYQLSWGGPSDEFRFYCDENRRVARVEYWFLDWFDGAHITLRDGSKAERLLIELFDWFSEAGVVESEYAKAMEE